MICSFHLGERLKSRSFLCQRHTGVRGGSTGNTITPIIVIEESLYHGESSWQGGGWGRVSRGKGMKLCAFQFMPIERNLGCFYLE